MANNLSPVDQMMIKMNEVIATVNTINLHGHGIAPRIEPLELPVYLHRPAKPVEYPPNSTTTDHSILGG